MPKRPGGALVQSAEPTRSQLIPILTKWEDMRNRKEQLAPFLFCILTFFVLNSFGNQKWIVFQFADDQGNLTNPLGWIYTSNLLIITSLFLTLASLYLIYRLVGKSKSWWILLGTMAFTSYFLWRFQTQDDFAWLYNLFHRDLAGGEVTDNMSLPALFINNIVGTGFFEEIVKIIPVLIVAVLTPRMSVALRQRIGVEEPLDGILLGAASGGGFALIETLGQYVSQDLAKLWFKTGLLNNLSSAILNDPNKLKAVLASLTNPQKFQLITDGYKILGTSPGMKSTIVRSIDLAFGHMAFAGYFGYFVGLAVIKPEHRWRILGIGLLSAAIPHALWDTLLQGADIPPLVAACALLSFGVLAAAILKAREISPNRALLQPSLTFGVPGATAPMAAAMAGRATAPEAVAVPQSPSYAVSGAPAIPVSPGANIPQGTAATGVSRLKIGSNEIVIAAGLRLMDYQIPGLSAQTPGGLVAEVTRNPSDPAVLGLTNSSTAVWQVVSANGNRRAIASGQTVRLAPGTRIDFGTVHAEVH